MDGRRAATALLAAAALLAGCADTTRVDPSIRGRVVDTAGAGVPGAALLFRYELDGPETAAPGGADLAVKARGADEELSFEIQYSIPEAGPVLLTVEEDCRGASAVTLVDEVQPAGAHVATWTGLRASRRVPNDLYVVRLQLGALHHERNLFVNASPEGLGPQQVWADGTTFDDGGFVVPQTCLPLGDEFTLDGAGGALVECSTSRVIDVWVLRVGHAAHLEEGLYVDPAGGLEVTIVVPE